MNVVRRRALPSLKNDLIRLMKNDLIRLRKRKISECGEKEGLAFTEKSLRGPRPSNPVELSGMT